MSFVLKATVDRSDVLALMFKDTLDNINKSAFDSDLNRLFHNSEQYRDLKRTGQQLVQPFDVSVFHGLELTQFVMHQVQVNSLTLQVVF